MYLHDERIRNAERFLRVIVDSDDATVEDCLAAAQEIRLAYEAKAAYNELAWKRIRNSL